MVKNAEAALLKKFKSEVAQLESKLASSQRWAADLIARPNDTLGVNLARAAAEVAEDAARLQQAQRMLADFETYSSIGA